MKKQKKSTKYLLQASAIAGLYATLTILQNVLLPGTASMAVQLRVSEVLTMLAVYTPAAIPGLTVGCVLANISSLSVLGPYDMIFGSLASLLAAVLMDALRNVRFFKLPILSALMPALANGIIVGFVDDSEQVFLPKIIIGFCLRVFNIEIGAVVIKELQMAVRHIIA